MTKTVDSLDSDSGTPKSQYNLDGESHSKNGVLILTWTPQTMTIWKLAPTGSSILFKCNRKCKYPYSARALPSCQTVYSLPAPVEYDPDADPLTLFKADQLESLHLPTRRKNKQPSIISLCDQSNTSPPSTRSQGGRVLCEKPTECNQSVRPVQYQSTQYR
ncbi:hypothetical protein FGIG_02078 [Fasciola gigantica]|uniref:Uncharacterized protein n=1 Tax=Fasciola gigantica TaxID=46835 RepID=A0A504YA85_FASGI|nr:hypothetical protein FGIG_02078 [Fasciola gigantica]